MCHPTVSTIADDHIAHIRLPSRNRDDGGHIPSSKSWEHAATAKSHPHIPALGKQLLAKGEQFITAHHMFIGGAHARG